MSTKSKSCIIMYVPCCTMLNRSFSRQEYWSGLPCPPPEDLFCGMNILHFICPFIKLLGIWVFFHLLGILNNIVMNVLSPSIVSDSLQPPGLQHTRLLCQWDSPCKNTGLGFHALLCGVFPTQGSNPGLPHCRWILYHLSHQRSPRILEWVAYPFSRGSSQPKN